MSIVLSGKSQQYIIKNNIQYILVDLIITEESCTKIFEPIIKILQKEDLGSYKELENISDGDLKLYISKNFIKTFGITDIFQIDKSGILKIKLVLSNVEPIIINTCKTN